MGDSIYWSILFFSLLIILFIVFFVIDAKGELQTNETIPDQAIEEQPLSIGKIVIPRAEGLGKFLDYEIFPYFSLRLMIFIFLSIMIIFLGYTQLAPIIPKLIFIFVLVLLLLLVVFWI